MTSIITARGLTKRYGATVALDGIDLDVDAGTVLALLGPNGAGKTTAVRILSTLVAADGGTATVAGHDVAVSPHEVRATIGLTGQYAAVDELLSGRENLVLIARLLGATRRDARRRAAELLERFDLTDAAHRPAGTYSGGMRRRLDLAASLVGRPAVLFLDEPTTGLDPRSRKDLWATIVELVDGGTTLLLTTQYLEEADALADVITVIDKGRVVARGTADELKARTGGASLHLSVAERRSLAPAVELLAPLGAVRDNGGIAVPLGDHVDMAPLVAHALRTIGDAGIAVDDVAVRRPSLDDVFLALTDDTAASDERPLAGSVA